MNANEKVTNLDYLVELSKGNKTFVEEMVTIFLTENPEELRMLETAIQEKDYARMKASAHKMKSTIPFVGLDRLLEKDLSDIEMLSLNQTDLARIKELFTHVKTICLKASEELATV